jgi:hypothetical protein
LVDDVIGNELFPSLILGIAVVLFLRHFFDQFLLSLHPFASSAADVIRMTFVLFSALLLCFLLFTRGMLFLRQGFFSHPKLIFAPSRKISFYFFVVSPFAPHSSSFDVSR